MTDDPIRAYEDRTGITTCPHCGHQWEWTKMCGLLPCPKCQTNLEHKGWPGLPPQPVGNP